jgi:dTDP-4-amino-4,6-dideoxygalactose transaminase
VASANAVLHQVCIPVFADIDPDTFNIDPISAEEKISPRTRAIMAVDMHGLPADYDALRKVASKHGLVIIGDAAHAVGASYKGQKIGNLADITGASIMPAKQLATCGEGGMFSTNNVDYYNRASMIRMFGEVIQKGQPRAYNSYTLGYNYRINPVQAAYGRSQLRRVDEYAAVFTANGTYLARGLQELKGIEPPFVPADTTHVYHMFRVKFNPAAAGLSIEPGRFARAVQDAMAAEGLPLRFYQNAPVPAQTIFRSKEGFGGGVPWTLPGAREVDYTIEDYPVTLETLENTRCIGLSGTSGPNYFRNRQTMDLYLEGFRKLWENLSLLAEYSQMIDYQPPWTSAAPSTRGVWTVIAPGKAKGGN